MRQVLYMAHPVAPTAEEISQMGDREAMDSGMIVRANLKRAMQWLSWLRKSFPETTFIAPWISDIMAGGGDSNPKQREAGLIDCCSVVERCDGIVLVGGRISSGMRREMEHGKARGFMRVEPDLHAPADRAFPYRAAGFEVYDLTVMGQDPLAWGWKGLPVTFVGFFRGWIP